MEESELEKLRQEIARLQARIDRLEVQLGLQTTATKPQEISGAHQGPQMAERSVAAVEKPVKKPDVTPENPPSDVEKAAPAAKRGESWEEKIGGTWLNRLGIIALLIGLGLGLKFAFDNDLIGTYGRIILGCIAGIALLGAGFWYRHRFPKFAAGLSGGGLGAFYLTVYAAFKFYGLMGNVAAFILMVVITAGAVGLALFYNNSVIASLGLLGGYLTPILIGGGNYLELLIYLVILNLGAAVLLSLKRWTWLSAISLAFTWILAGIWISKFLVEANLLSFLLFISAYNFIFSILGLVHNFVHRRSTDLPITGVLLISNIVYGIFTANLLLKKHLGWLMAVFVAWGVFYLFQMVAVNRWRRQDRRLSLLLLYLALGYFTLAVPSLLHKTWVTIAWAIWAVVLSVAGAHLGHLRLRQFGLLVMALALLRLIFYDMQRLTSTVNIAQKISSFSWFDRLPAVLVVTAAMLVIAWIYTARRYSISSQERRLAPWLGVIANVSLLGCVLKEIDAYFYDKYIYSLPSVLNFQYRSSQYVAYRNTASSIFMAAQGFILVAVGFWRKYKIIRWTGLVLLLITIGKIVLVDLTGVETGWRIIVFLATGLVLLVVSYLYQRHIKRAQQRESQE